MTPSQAEAQPRVLGCWGGSRDGNSHHDRFPLSLLIIYSSALPWIRGDVDILENYGQFPCPSILTPSWKTQPFGWCGPSCERPAPSRRYQVPCSLNHRKLENQRV
jgi:hypothetical protein